MTRADREAEQQVLALHRKYDDVRPRMGAPLHADRSARHRHRRCVGQTPPAPRRHDHAARQGCASRGGPDALPAAEPGVRGAEGDDGAGSPVGQRHHAVAPHDAAAEVRRVARRGRLPGSRDTPGPGGRGSAEGAVGTRRGGGAAGGGRTGQHPHGYGRTNRAQPPSVPAPSAPAAAAMPGPAAQPASTPDPLQLTETVAPFPMPAPAGTQRPTNGPAPSRRGSSADAGRHHRAPPAHADSHTRRERHPLVPDCHRPAARRRRGHRLLRPQNPTGICAPAVRAASLHRASPGVCAARPQGRSRETGCGRGRRGSAAGRQPEDAALRGAAREVPITLQRRARRNDRRLGGADADGARPGRHTRQPPAHGRNRCRTVSMRWSWHEAGACRSCSSMPPSSCRCGVSSGGAACC